jgi:tetratricopeptide (TPR) repeat protein
VRGEPGVGKTRLVRELQQRSPHTATWLHVRCSDGLPPSAPLGAIIRAHVALPESAALSEWRDGFDKLLGTLLADADEREWLRRLLGPAAGLGEPSMAERSEIVAAWVTYLAATARQGATVIVLDDVHRADPAFDTLLTDCFTQLRDLPLLLLSTARPELPDRTFQWVGTDNLTLTLRGLDEAETDALLDHLLADDPVTEAQHMLVRARSSGNPLYAIQFARMLRQQGWSGSIPHSTRSLISARLDLLAPLERAMLFAGAVADQPFGSDQLAAMQGVDATAAELALQHLVDKALLTATARNEMSFTHDLVREVAYEHLSRSGRARLHEAAAAWMEQRAGDRLADDAMRIVNHVSAAANAHEEDGEDTTDQRAQVVRLMIVAGDRLRGLGLEDTASRLAEAVQADHSPADLAELQRQHAVALARVGRLIEAADAARRGLEAARQVDDRPLQARLSAVVGEVQWLRGETASCIDALEEALTLVDDLPTDRAATEAIATLAFITALLGRPAEGIALAERGLVLAREHGMADREVRCLNAHGAAVLLQGNIEGYNDFMRALTRALEAGLGHESAMAYHNLAELQLQGAGTASSIELNERGLDLAERRGLTLAADWLRANRVSVFFEAGRWDEALALAAQVIANETRSGPGQAGTMCAVWSARIHVWRGDLDRAIRLMDTFLPRARQHAVIQQVGPALIVAGLIMTASGRADEGAAYAEEYCALTEGTRAYRHMEMADVVRLLVAASRADRAAAVADNDVIPTFRNECESRTADATLAVAGGDAGAFDVFQQAAALWNSFGHPLEEHLALASAAAIRSDPDAAARARLLATDLLLAGESVAALCPYHAVTGR